MKVAVVVLGAVSGVLGVASVTTALTVTDPTGSVSVGVPLGGGGNHAQGSILAYSMGGCARSGLVAVSYSPLAEHDTDCPWSGAAVEAPVAVSAEKDTRGTVAVSEDDDAAGSCWNPFAIGCLPSVAYGGVIGYGTATGGTVSLAGESCFANDYGLVPGIAVCGGNQHTEESASGSIAVMTGSGAAYGRLFAFSDGNSSPFREHHAYSDNIAVSEWGKAYGGKVAFSLHHEAHSGAGGVAIAGITWPFNLYPNPADAYTGPGGVAIAGGRANGGAVAVAGGDATAGSGGVVAVSLTGDATGAAVNVGLGQYLCLVTGPC